MLFTFAYCLLTIFTALVLDQLLGEPKRFHPLVKFGQVANFIEKRLNTTALIPSSPDLALQLRGVLAWLCSVLPWVILTIILAELCRSGSSFDQPNIRLWLLECLMLYLAIGRKSLKQHVRAISDKLANHDLSAARSSCALIVSRDTSNSNETELASAAIESTLENSCDGIFAALFWFAILGAPGIVLYRLSNTLDAMWGYRSERFENFGKFSARVDDLLNYLPARITAIVFALLSRNPGQAFNHWHTQAPLLSSPNGGPVMVCGASALDLRVGGPAVYQGRTENKPFFGGSKEPTASDIDKVIVLNDKALIGWIIIASLLNSLLFHSFLK